MFIPYSIIGYTGMILLPLIAGFFIAKKFKLGFKDFRKLFTAGALTFIASQVLHIPVVYGLTALFSNGILPSPDKSITLIFNAVVLGLLAGIFEETARYILFKAIRKSTDTWQNGIVIGLGHGGIEAILLGIISISTMAQMIAMRDPSNLSALNLPADQVGLVQEQINAYWNQPDVMPLFGFMERISAMSLHIGLSILVLYSIVANQKKWFWIALLWHAFVDAVAVYVFPKITAGENVAVGVFGFELMILLLGVGVLAYAIRLRTSFPVKNEAPTK
ncbi:MAG: YhfC family intramembrane metalloprotease [Anaerolineales bacterium]|nr:YhfC family intramembrane metalloprotease [Anaerolineales bacterium]